MKKLATALVLVAVAAVISGCSNMEVARKTNYVSVTPTGYTPAMAQLTYTNYGFYLFNCIPIVAGSVSSPDSFALFANTIKTENAVLELTRCATNLGATKVVNLNTHYVSRYNWYTLFFWTREVEASGTAIE